MISAAQLDPVKFRKHQAFMAECRPKLKELEGIRRVKKRVFLWRKKIGIRLSVIITPFLAYIDWMLLELSLIHI